MKFEKLTFFSSFIFDLPAMQTAAAQSYEKKITGPIKKSIGTAAKTIGKYWYDANTPEWIRCSILAIPYGFFNILAYRKIRKACGLDRCQLLYTGAAPLNKHVFSYLRAVNLPLLEVFGMSESTGAIAVCGPNDTNRPIGACGKPLPNGKLEIAADKEVLWLSGNVMTGYKGQPAATQATVNPDTKFLHTGDLGRLDSDNYLYIVGRKKELIITAGGENVAPVPVEESILSILNSKRKNKVGHVVLVGDQRKMLTVLIAPPEQKDDDGIDMKSVEEALAIYNQDHAKSRAQRVQKAHVLDSPLTVQTGELTPTMKIKRNFVLNKYAKEIDAMYEAGSNMVGYSSMNIGKLDSTIA